MSDALVRLSALPRVRAAEVLWRPEAAERAEIAASLDLLGLRKLRLEGRLIPESTRDWRLEAVLGATAVQACVATGAPVTTRLDVPVTRRYLADFAPPTEAEAEMPEDDTAEPLPARLDLGVVAAEALALALPDYPRAEGAPPVDAEAAPPGATEIGSDTDSPFAALARLKKDRPE